MQSQQIVTNPSSIFIVNMPWVSFGKMRVWYKGYNWVREKNDVKWIDLYFFSQDFLLWNLSGNNWGFFKLTSGYLVYDIEILSFLSSPSFVTFLALVQALPLTTNLLTFTIRRIWNLGTSSYHDRRNYRQTHIHSIQQQKDWTMLCPRDRILPYWNM